MAKTIKKIAGKKPVESQISVAEFNALPKATQRVMIAKDVIENLKAKKYIANKGRYVEKVTVKGKLKNEISISDVNVRDNWKSIDNCLVCGIGSCLMSVTKFKNRLTFGELPRGIHSFEDKHIKLLKSTFSPNHLTLIEVAFEGYYYKQSDNLGRDKMEAEVNQIEISRAKTFANQYEDNNERLEAIMRNIVTNKGTFKP